MTKRDGAPTAAAAPAYATAKCGYTTCKLQRN